MREPTESVIHTLWKTVDTQCELVFVGILGARLRLWIDGHLMVDEDVRDVAVALRRSVELKVSFRAAGNALPHCRTSRGGSEP